MKQIFTTLTLLYFTGCFVPKKTVTPLGYFSINPYSKPQLSVISKNLNIFLAEDVKDNVSLDQYDYCRLNVVDFRKSVSEAITNAFRKNFDHVIVVNQIQENEPTLILYRIDPLWTLGSVSNANAISATFQYESTLLFNGQKISSADGRANSDLKVDLLDHNQHRAVFKDGLKLTIESIEKGLMTDDAVQKLNKN